MRTTNMQCWSPSHKKSCHYALGQRLFGDKIAQMRVSEIRLQRSMEIHARCDEPYRSAPPLKSGLVHHYEDEDPARVRLPIRRRWEGVKIS
jgi:hypothetical protein